MAEENHQVEHAIHFMYAVSKTRDHERLSYMLYVQIKHHMDHKYS